MADDDDVHFCSECSTHFNSSDTLAKHRSTFHETAKAAAAPPATASEPINFEDGSNLEIAPLLTVLSEQQKDLLLLRAIHSSPSLIDELIGVAASPLTPETARERVEELRGNTGVHMIRAYAEIGSPANALTLLVALTEALLEALEELLDIMLPGNGATGGDAEELGGDGASWENSEELRVVEGMPAAGTLAALWCEILTKPGARKLSDEDELDELLHNAQVPPSLPRVVLPLWQ